MMQIPKQAISTTDGPLFSCGHELDLSPESFGELRDSHSLLDDPASLRDRFEEDGYLFLRGFLPEDEVLAARQSVLDRLAEQGLLHPDHPPMEGVAHPDHRLAFKPDLAKRNPRVEQLIYGPRLMGFYERLFGKPAAHFDYTWFRAIAPGKGTHPHCDWVYMSRGSENLRTCWIPYGDVSLKLGGLLILEQSHHQRERLRAYLSKDVDSYCENHPDQAARAREGKWNFRGWLTSNPASLRERMGGRWLTAEYRPGDILTFRMDLIHASLDNRTDRIRLSSDSRYQPADEPLDERWIGPDPVGHTAAGKRGRIC